MRVAYVCADPGVPVFGKKGCTVHVQEVVRALIAAGAEVELFASRVDGDAPRDLEYLRLHSLPRPPKGDAAARELACLAANDDLAALLRRRGSFDLVYERYSLWSYAGMEHARETGAAGVLEVNAPLVLEHAAYRTLVHRAEAEHVAARAFAAADVLAAVSSGMAEHLRAHPSARGRVQVVPNGVNPRRFRPDVPPARPAPPGTFTVGFCGNLKPWHGVPVLIDAFARLHRRRPNTRLLVVGDGPERESLELDVAARGLDGAVQLVGRVDADEVPGLLRSMDVATAPYPRIQDFYFSPLKLCEYMAAGLPVVASRIGQLEEVLTDGVTGLLCPPGDAAALADVLERLMDDAPARAALAAAAREAVLRERTWDAVVRRVLTLAGFPPRHAAPESRPLLEVTN